MESCVGHPYPAQEIKTIQIQPKRAIGFQIHEVLVDRLHIFRLAIWREAHQLVLAGIDAEPTVRSERRIEQAERVREAQLLERFQTMADPWPMVVVAYSSTPSTVTMAASSNGDG